MKQLPASGDFVLPKKNCSSRCHCHAAAAEDSPSAAVRDQMFCQISPDSARNPPSGEAELQLTVWHRIRIFRPKVRRSTKEAEALAPQAIKEQNGLGNLKSSCTNPWCQVRRDWSYVRKVLVTWMNKKTMKPSWNMVNNGGGLWCHFTGSWVLFGVHCSWQLKEEETAATNSDSNRLAGHGPVNVCSLQMWCFGHGAANSGVS